MREMLASHDVRFRAVETLIGLLIVLAVVLVLSNGVVWAATDTFTTWYADLFATQVHVEDIGPQPPQREAEYVPGMGMYVPYEPASDVPSV